jgi:PTS system N-acetylglucosamine-specific IIC component
MFLAPALYAIHAVLTGISMALMHTLGVKLGFGFSAGLFDYVLNFGIAQKPLLLIPIGLAYFAVYYVLFTFFIKKFNLMTMGREEAVAGAPAAASLGSKGSDRARGFIGALGGAANLKSVDACTTRLRLQVVSNDAIDEAALKALGSRGMIKPAAGSVQVVLGPEAELVADEIRVALANPQAVAADGGALKDALGGAANIRAVEVVAGSRLRVELADASRVNEGSLKALGVSGVMAMPGNLVHLVVEGGDPAALASQLQ